MGGGWVRGESGRLAGLPNSEGRLLASAELAAELVFPIAPALLFCYYAACTTVYQRGNLFSYQRPSCLCFDSGGLRVVRQRRDGTCGTHNTMISQVIFYMTDGIY